MGRAPGVYPVSGSAGGNHASLKTVGLIVSIALFFASLTANIALAATNAQLTESYQLGKDNSEDISEIKGDIRVITTEMGNLADDVEEIKLDLKEHRTD